MPKKTLKTPPIALLEHVLIKNWLTNTTSLNTRSADAMLFLVETPQSSPAFS